MAIAFQHKRGTASKWITVNPILLSGEPGYETDTGKFKIGNGILAWIDLPYSSGSAGPKGDSGEQGIQGIQGPPGSGGTVQFENVNNFTFGSNTNGVISASFSQSTHAHPYQSTGSYLTTAALSIHTHDYQSTGAYLTTYTQSTHSHETFAALTHIHSDLYQSTGNYLTTAAQSVHTHNYQSTGAYLTTAQPVGNYLTTAAQSDHTHNYQSTGNYLTTAMLSQNSSLYLPIGNSTQWATGTLSSALMPLGYSSGFQTATLATKFLTTAAASNHTHSDLYVNTSVSGNFLTTAANSTHNHGGFTGTNITGTYNSSGLQLSVAAPGGGDTSSCMNTSERVNYFYTSNNTLANSTHSHGNPTLALTNLSGTTASASNGLTLSLSAANPGGGAAVNRSFIEIMQGERLTRPFNMTASQLSNRPLFVPFWLDGEGLAASTVRMLVSFVTNILPPVMTYGAAIYTTNNTSQLGLLCSTTATMNYASSQSASFSGIRVLDITGMTTPIPDGRAVLAYFFSGAATGSINFSIYGGDGMAPFVGFLSGASGTSTTADTQQFLPWWGRYSANSGAFPDTVNRTQIYGGRSADLVDLYAVIKQI
jgi:hypothetical protein